MSDAGGPATALPSGMRHSPSRRRSGFTIIEMLTVFVVFGAVAMISMRAVGDTLRRDRVAKASAIVGTDIEQAFAIAAAAAPARPDGREPHEQAVHHPAIGT